MPVVGKHDNTLAVTPGAETWLKTNFGISLDTLGQQQIQPKPSKPKMKRTFSARPGFRTDQTERSSVRSEFIPDHFHERGDNHMPDTQDFKIRTSTKKRRPMSAYSGASRMSRSSVKSAASIVPKMTRANALFY